MGYDVYYNPTVKTLGQNALRAGLGQYSLKQQARQDSKQAQKRQIASSERMQRRSLQSQAKNYADLRTFQGEQKRLDREHQTLRDASRYDNAANEFDRRAEYGRKEETRKFVNNGWKQFVGSIKNMGDFDEQQKLRWKEIEGGVREVLSNKAHTPEEKEMAIKQAIVTAQGLVSSVVPRAKSQQEQWATEGKPAGGTWYEDGRMMARDMNGNIKSLDRKSPTETRMDGAMEIMKNHNANDIEGKNPMDLSTAMKQYDLAMNPAPPKPVVPKQIKKAAPLAVKALEAQGADPANMPPEMLADYNNALKLAMLTEAEAPKKRIRKEIEEFTQSVEDVKEPASFEDDVDVEAFLSQLPPRIAQMLTPEQVQNMTEAQRKRMLKKYKNN